MHRAVTTAGAAAILFISALVWTAPAPAPAAAATSASGYWLAGADGRVLNYGAAPGYGSAARPSAPIAAMAGTPDGRGYWLVGRDGAVYPFGAAASHGSMGGVPLNKPVVGMAATPSGQGYWMVATDGGIFAFGDARSSGSMGGRPLNQPVVGMTMGLNTASYRLVAADGGIFSFGAPFYGSMGGRPLNAPIVGMAPTRSGLGYWMVARDGGIFAFGDAGFYGSMGGQRLNGPIVGMVTSPTGAGYWLIGSDGGVFAFGDAGFLGSAGGQGLGVPVVALAPYTPPPPAEPPTTTTTAPTTTTSTSTTTTTTTPPPPDPDVLAAGDIASCASTGDEATANILDAHAGPVLLLGDNVYENGTLDEFNNCYDPSWGRHKSRTRPIPGNHEYQTPNATGYFDYFGSAAGTPGQGYYSFDVGAWHVIALNSELCPVGGTCASAELNWLQADLAAHANACTLAYWHEPRFSSGDPGDHPEVDQLWDAMYAAGADIVLTGHHHSYERFAPLDGNGNLDQANGVRQFVVGTGGKSHHVFTRTRAGSEAKNDDTFGVLRLSLHATSYDWEFLPVAGKTYNDSGTDTCH